jgi:hypothetical protein
VKAIAHDPRAMAGGMHQETEAATAAIPDLAQHGDAVAAVRFRVRDRQRCEQFGHRFPPAARYLGARLLPHWRV